MTLCTRRQFVAGSLAGLAAGSLTPSARGADVPRGQVSWLAEIQRPPDPLPADAPRLSPLLVDGNGKPVTTLEGWKLRREELRQAWLEFLGPLPAERDPRQPPKLTVVEEDRPEGVIRQLVRYEVEPGLLTEAYLLRPAKLTTEKTAGTVPGIVAFHSTVDHSIRQPAGVEGAPEKFFGLKLAQQGCIALCPRNYLWPTNHKIAAPQEAAAFLKRQPKSKGMAKMLYDALVAVDILAAQPGVDPGRIGAVGHSLGAKETLYLAAFDERVQATVSSEGGIGTKFSNWEAAWYLGPVIQDAGFTREHHELLALAAPRAFLLVGGESADGDRGWPFIAAAVPVYELYGRPARVGQFNHRQGHAVPPPAEARIGEWLLTYL